MAEHALWYRGQASEWTEALPLGNGRLGVMVFGRTTRDEFQLNEETLWSGGPYRPTNPNARRHLEEVRQLIFAGRYIDAEKLANRHLLGRPFLQTSFQPAGRLLLEAEFDGPHSRCERRLDLARAVTSSEFVVNDVTYCRESFVSAPDGVLVIRLTSDAPDAIGFALDFVSEQPGKLGAAANRLRFDGRNRGENGIAGVLRWAMEARILAEGGSLQVEDGQIRVTGAQSATILLDIATSFRRYDDVSGDPDALIAARLDAAEAKSYDDLIAAHCAAHAALYDRFSLALGGPVSDLPTDERIEAFSTTHDPGLVALYVQFARYLAICSSRPGTQPANLQGIWNKEIRPPWGSKYTANINLQMNYWLADPANLVECFEPLVAMVEELAETGSEMARIAYGARGWALHHNTDLWRATSPIDGARSGVWPTCGAWLCAQLWDHARFAGFPRDMVERLYPLLSGATEFFVDTLVPLPGTSLLVTNPSLSPENLHPHGSSLCAGPAMDSQILRDLFGATIHAAELLGRDPDFVRQLVDIRERLPADRIGAQGQLQEWLEDWDAGAPEQSHRHVSHLYGLYPSLQIDVEHTPALAEAARRSLETRGDLATGWAIGWRINLWARLRDGVRAQGALRLLLHPARTYPNLLDAHPPFQIDGNFGGAAGILEMLVQSNDEEIVLLPALPAEWTEGSVRGIRARGGITLDFSWKDDRITKLDVHDRAGYLGSITHKGATLWENNQASRQLAHSH